MKIVISQSMLFPWVGLLEQIRLADVFVHYDDVQFSKGSFVNRVQLKTPSGMKWMTVPLKQVHLGQRIDDIELMPESKWLGQHLSLLKQSFDNAPYAHEALKIAEEVYSQNHANLGALARSSLLALARYYAIDKTTKFVDVRELNISGSSSDRVLDVVKLLHGDTYITGHGAARYLQHEKFEQNGIQVEYMKYRLAPYPQSYGEFTPYVSGLDLVAHCGQAGIEHICSTTLPWRTFVNESN